MNPQPFNIPFEFSNGFFPSQLPYGATIPGTVYDGSNAWMRGPAFWESDRGTAAQGSSGGVSDLSVVGGQLAGCIGTGNVWKAFSTDWFVGNAFLGGVNIGNSPSVLSLLVSGSPTPAGLARPVAPTFVASATTGTLNGSYAVAVAAFRQTTGAVSTISLLSGAISVKNKKGILTFPAAPAGTTHWLVFGTRKGFGSIGPAFRITTIAAVTVGTPTLELDWVDGYLGALGSLTNDPPPNCTHVCAIGGSVGALGTGTGSYGCRFSLVGFPEAFPPQFHFDLPVREPITGVHPGVDGVVVITTAHSVVSLVATGSDLVPVLPRVIFGEMGCSRQNNLAIVFDQFYMFNGESGAMRTQGNSAPDSSFAIPVARYFEQNGFTEANTVVVHDKGRNAVIYASGTKAVPFNYQLNTWSSPITLPGAVTAGVGKNNMGLLQIGSSVVALDRGGVDSNWYLRSPRVPASQEYSGHIGTLKEHTAAASHGVTIDLENENGTSIGGLFPYVISPPHGAAGKRVLRPNRKFRDLRIKVSGSLRGQTFEMSRNSGYVEPCAA